MISDEGAHRRPRDRRSRIVTATVADRNGAVLMQLECGHEIRRRPLCWPSRVICREC